MNDETPTLNELIKVAKYLKDGNTFSVMLKDQDYSLKLVKKKVPKKQRIK